MMDNGIVVRVRIPKEWLDEIEEKVRKYIYPNKSAFIRRAIYELLERERYKIY